MLGYHPGGEKTKRQLTVLIWKPFHPFIDFIG